VDDGSGRLKDPDAACGDGERISGGYGNGARERQARADKKCETISVGVGDAG